MRGAMLDAVPVTSLSGVGAKMAEKLEKIGLNTVQDLLFHLPYRYEDRTRVWPIAGVLPGQHATVEGEIFSNETIFGKRRMLRVKIRDASGVLTLRFFNFNAAMKNSLANGKRVKAYGEIKAGMGGPEIIHPEYTVFSEPTEIQLEKTLTPVYPTTEGLRQLTLRSLTDQALVLLESCAVKELLPEGLYDRQMTLSEALKTLHRPTPDISVEQLEQGNIRHKSALSLRKCSPRTSLCLLCVIACNRTKPGPCMVPASSRKNCWQACLSHQPVPSKEWLQTLSATLSKTPR